MKFLALLLLIPMAEIVVFVQVGDEIGALWTVLLTFGTAALGLFLVRTQGVRTILVVKQQLEQRQLPATAMIGALILFFSGVMLLIPGFITDTLGFLGLIPFVRQFVAMGLTRGVIKTQTHRQQETKSRHIIDGEFRRDD